MMTNNEVRRDMYGHPMEETSSKKTDTEVQCEKPEEIIVDKTYFKLDGDCDGDGDGSGDSSGSTSENQKGESKDVPDDFYDSVVLKHHWNPHPEDEEETFFGIPPIEELKEDDNLFLRVRKKFRW